MVRSSTIYQKACTADWGIVVMHTMILRWVQRCLLEIREMPAVFLLNLASDSH